MPFGPPEYVLEQMLTIPHARRLPGCLLAERVLWPSGKGIILEFGEDMTTIAPGEVISISIMSSVVDKDLFRLYVQVFERLAATLLVEKNGMFLTPREFKKRLPHDESHQYP